MLDFEIVANKDSFLADVVADFFNKKIIRPEIENFADTETVVRFSEFLDFSNKTIFLIHQFSFFNKNIDDGISINNQLFKIFLLIDLMKKMGAKKIIGLFPYLPYSRQDKSFKGRYIGAISLIGKFFKQAGTEQIISVDLHELEIKKFFEVKLDEINLEQFWTNFLSDSKKELFQELNLEYCIVSPDKGRIEKNKKIAEQTGMDFAYIHKKRIGKDIPIALDLVGSVQNKIVIVIDDIIDTARTAINACDILIKNGAKKVIGCFTHAVMTKGAIEKVDKSRFDKIFITDSIQLENNILNYKKISILSIGNLLCNWIKDFKNED